MSWMKPGTPLRGGAPGLQRQQALPPLAHGRIARAAASLALGNDPVGRELPVVPRGGNPIFLDGIGLEHVDQFASNKAL